MAEDDGVRVFAVDGIAPLGEHFNAPVERRRDLRSRQSLHGKSRVADDHVRADLRHFDALFQIVGIWRCHHIVFTRHAQKLQLHLHADALGVEIRDNGVALHLIHAAHAGHVLHAGITRLPEFREKAFHIAERVLHEYAAEYRYIRAHRHDLARHAQHEAVCIAERKAPAHGTAPRHAIFTRAVYDDNVRAAVALGSGREPGARARADDGRAAFV